MATTNKQEKFWDFKAQSEEVGELWLYGYISNYDYWDEDITPKRIKEDLDALGDIKTLNIYMNSLGGSVQAGKAIKSILERCPAEKYAHIDSWIASMATFIACVAKKVYIYDYGMYMIHHPWSYEAGNYKELRKAADISEKMSEIMVGVYAKKTGLSRDKIVELMDKETWLNATEALEYGFVDEIIESNSNDLNASLRGNEFELKGQIFDISKFRNFPKEKVNDMGSNTANSRIYSFASQAQPQKPKKEEGDDPKMEITAKMIKDQHPEIYQAIYEDGIKAEQTRLKEIDELSVDGAEVIIFNAKYVNPISAGECATKILKAEKEKKGEILAKIQEDADAIPEVKSEVPEEKGESKKVAFNNAFLKGANSNKGGVK